MYTKRIIAISLGTIISYSTYGITWGMNDIASVMGQNMKVQSTGQKTTKLLDSLNNSISRKTEELRQVIQNGHLNEVSLISQNLDTDVASYADYLKVIIASKYHSHIEDIEFYTVVNIVKLKEHSKKKELTKSQRSLVRIQVYWKQLEKLHKDLSA